LGFVGTTLLGIVGSVIGGLIARLFSKPPAGSKFHPAGFLSPISSKPASSYRIKTSHFYGY
jgi:uncharacterized membrane protein YeaQ/YmgE (transglycosylase-associated protein family)